MACPFQTTTGGKFAPLMGLRNEDMDIKTMISTHNTVVTGAASVDTLEGTSQEKNRGPLEMLSTSVMRGEI